MLFAPLAAPPSVPRMVTVYSGFFGAGLSFAASRTGAPIETQSVVAAMYVAMRDLMFPPLVVDRFEYSSRARGGSRTS
jgi:hypothetical protein